MSRLIPANDNINQLSYSGVFQNPPSSSPFPYPSSPPSPCSCGCLHTPFLSLIERSEHILEIEPLFLFIREGSIYLLFSLFVTVVLLCHVTLA